MATTSYTIYSHYDPEKDKERLQRETGQIQDEVLERDDDDEATWRQAASAQFLRSQKPPPPKFVPATIAYELGGNESNSSSSLKGKQRANPFGLSLSEWYRSLTSTQDTASGSESPPSTKLDNVTPRSPSEGQETTKFRSRRIKGDKNDWFIQRSLQSEPTPSSSSSPSPSLADMLARDPPPLPSEPKYTPPVWTEIGPSNRGFRMLQRGGWNEGESLGPSTIQRRITTVHSSLSSEGAADFDNAVTSTVSCNQGGRAGIGASTATRIKEEERAYNSGGEEGIEIIDLTISDTESEADIEDHRVYDRDRGPTMNVEAEGLSYQAPDSVSPSLTKDLSNHGRKALLTPIATVLKLDRLGIGLKAKTQGPYKASVKRVTHNMAALLSHKKAAEEARRKREKFGRGRRGYEKQHRREEERRKQLLAYLNT